MPADILKLFLILAGEVTIGIFIGLMMRIIQGTLHMAGMKIAFMTGLSTAMLFDANQSTQGSVIGGFLAVIGITVFFTTNLHHIALRGILDSYNVIQVAKMPPFNEFADMGASLLSESFFVAFKISAPGDIGRHVIISICRFDGPPDANHAGFLYPYANTDLCWVFVCWNGNKRDVYCLYKLF
jgi:flagellar biosynthesis protein FliR